MKSDMEVRIAAFQELVSADADRLALVALEEDGNRDITTDVCVPAGTDGIGVLEYRTGGVLAGTRHADAVVAACGLPPIEWSAREGDLVAPDTRIGELRGDLAAILRAERPLLNMIQRASGIANATRAFTDALAGTDCQVLHTRKTAPGLRILDISAVLAGGGALHRSDLAQTVMVKDNHWQALRGRGIPLSEAVEHARKLGSRGIHVEVESLEQVELACAAHATRLLVDNQLPETVRDWAQIARRLVPGIEIEATGGITIANAREYAEAGADFVSIGGLTHSVRGADIALEVSEAR